MSLTAGVVKNQLLVQDVSDQILYKGEVPSD